MLEKSERENIAAELISSQAELLNMMWHRNSRTIAMQPDKGKKFAEEFHVEHTVTLHRR